MRKWIVIGFTLALVAFRLQSSSQTLISGKVTDTLNKPLRDINVMVYPKHSGILKAYAITDQNGRYVVEVNLETDSLDLLLSSIHFERIKLTIPNQTQKLDFSLKPDTKLLETITVKANPIDLKGDTISYLIEQFKGREDQTIEDVLKKLPGIEVEESGKILYQGLPINKFYVEGLDLTDGRYAMISSNLPHESVSTVEVFEKHQPIRILEDRVYSQQAALNIKLKNKTAYTGSGKIGSGFEPWLWDVKFTPMLLSNKMQLLASYQSNNTGDDVSRQINRFARANKAVFPFQPSETLSLFDLSDLEQYAGLDTKRYLDNQIHLSNINVLIPLKKDLQLRATVFYVNDLRRNQSFEDRTYYLPEDTIRLFQDYKRKQTSRYWHGTFDLNRNTSHNYLKNKTSFTLQKEIFHDRILNETDTIKQYATTPYSSFSNTLNSIFKSGKNLIEFQSLIQYDQGPQELSVAPGPFEAIINSNKFYDTAFQSATLRRFYADHFVGSNLKWKRWIFSIRFGFALRLQTLQSKLEINSNGEQTEAGDSFQNQLDAHQYQIYTIPALQYKFKRLRVSVDWPLNMQQFKLQDASFNTSKSVSKLLQAPKLSINYNFGGFWDVNASWYYLQRLSDPDNFYFAYMLKNYRELIKTEAFFQQTNQQIASASLSYRNAITAFFNTLSYVFVQRQMSLTYSTQLQENGSFIVTALELPNTSQSHNIQFRSSKYIHALKSSLSLNTSFMLNKGKTLVNNESFDAVTMQYNLSPEIYYQTTTWLNFNYKIHHNVMSSYISGDLRSQIRMNRHYFSINLFPTDRHLLNFNLEYFRFDNTDYNFVDMMYRYSFPKSRFKLEARWNNLLNSNDFLTQYNYQFTVLTTTQNLRPSQILISLRFSF
ncbi:MAG: hypothetical protein PHP48_01515 [Bacteroidales bacterium]|nr:hypothetical protein [Bacteroidales bacterium]